MIFGALDMCRIQLHLVREDLERAALTLAEAGVLDPEPADMDEALDEAPAESFASTYGAARQRFEKISRFLRFEPAGHDAAAALTPVSQDDLVALDERLTALWQQCSASEEHQRRLHERAATLKQKRAGLEVFSRLDMDLGYLQGEHEFLDLRVGVLDRNQVARLRDALAITGHSVLEFHHEEQVSHVAIVGLKGTEDELRTVLKAAGFHALETPRELTGHPEKVRRDLDSDEAALKREQAEIDARVAQLCADNNALLEQAADQLAAAAPFASLSGALRSKGGLVRLEGWVPEREVPELRRRLGGTLDAYHLQTRKPTPDELANVPSVQRYPSWISPFASLVRGYGTPRYDEFDPTWLFAITFTLMFGMMFGDVGHGLVIVAASWALRRKLGQFTRFGIIAGLSSTVFGLLYGSIFGYEDLMHPLWMSPLHDPMRLLILALYWGIGFILVATALSAWNLWRHGARRRALLGVKGVAGLAFYLGALVVLGRAATGAELGFLDALLPLVPLGLILAEVWRETQAKAGERALVTFMEGFEAVMGYVSNTLSFLRVAAFSLNHAALAIAVMTLAGMLDTAGHWIAIVIGNIIILGLEGGIVLIQVLRLEYYEGFARFFGGDGRVYRPLTLHRTAAARSQR